MGEACPEGFTWGLWSSYLGDVSPCFFDVILYGIFCLCFWAVGGMYLRELVTASREHISLLPRKTLLVRAKQILVNLMIAMGTINLIASIVNDDPDYLVVHYFFFILSWTLSAVLLALERAHAIEEHHWGLKVFWGMSLVLVAFSLRQVILLRDLHYFNSFHVVLYVFYLVFNFALGVLTILLKPKPEDRRKHYASVHLEDIVDGAELWLVDKQERHKQVDNDEDNWVEDVTWDLVKRILHYGLPEAWMLVSATVLTIIASTLGMAKSLVFGILVNALIGSESEHDAMKVLNEYIELMLIVYVIESIMAALGLAIMALVGERIAIRLRNTVYSCILSQDISFFDTSPPGELINRIVNDTGMLTGVIMTNMSSWVTPIIQGTVAFVTIFIFSWRLTLVTLALSPAMLSCLYISGKVNQMLTQKDLDALAKANATTEEGIRSIKTIRAFGTEAFEAARYERDLYVSYDICILKAWINGFIGQYQHLLSNCMNMIGIWYGGSLVVRGELKFGFLMAYFQFQGTALGSLKAIVGIFPQFAAGVGASKRIFQMLDRERTVRFCGGTRIEDPKGNISFKEVCFAYPSKPQLILQGIDLEIKQGETHALVGPSGGGKSTIINLLNAFYYVSAGSLSMDGHQISELDPIWYRRLLGYVAQEPVLFNRTLRDNISYGTIATEEQIVEAARKAFVLDFALDKEKFPDGFESQVGVSGGTLSGGQKQRVAIARALLRNPKVLLLDEATSALDSESEEYIQAALEQFMSSCTSVVIAHRLATVKRATKIHVIQKGTVIESGTHEELKEKGGVYTELARRQFGAEEEEGPAIAEAEVQLEQVTDVGAIQKMLGTKHAEVEDAAETFSQNLKAMGAPDDLCQLISQVVETNRSLAKVADHLANCRMNHG